MKKIVCELCGCTDLEKKDGSFVCAGCGAKYSVEEAKALLRDVSDSAEAAPAPAPAPAKISADTNFFEKGDKPSIPVSTPIKPAPEEPATEVFTKISDESIGIAEGYAVAAEKAKATLKVNDMAARREAFNALTAYVSSIASRFNAAEEAALRDVLVRIGADVVEIYVGDCIFSDDEAAKKSESEESTALFVSLADAASGMYTDIFAKIPAEGRASAIYLKKCALDLEDLLGGSGFISARERITHLERCRTLVAEIKAVEPSFTAEEDYAKLIATEEKFDKNFESGKKQSSGGCCGGCCIPVAVLTVIILILFI